MMRKYNDSNGDGMERGRVHMLLRMDRLRLKEVIDIGSGDRYGFVCDLEIDTDSGQIRSLVVLGRLRLWGLLGREDDIVIPWQSIRRIGEDTVLADGTQIGSNTEVRRGRDRKYRKLF